MIEQLAINSLLIFGIHASTRRNMLLSYFYQRIAAGLAYCLFKLYKKDVCKSEDHTAIILKPIFDCPPCMASVWGLPFALMQPLSIWTLVYLASLTGLNFIIMRIVTNNGRD